ncbi:F-box/LRR-repeat protein 3 [Vitis vinifera]|uniref:F-box/LRR-repeat protein 3 n=1 Tax=Vitis vinifera TaxID=29760 RepID=A0A438FAG6_VITVI|nr:F-box/LRR-repeat protein 3 [Vitis vinifera]
MMESPMLELVVQSLPEIDLYRCICITDVGIEAIAHGCPDLEMINTAYCDKVTDASLESLSKCLRLKALEIRGCPGVSSVGLSAIALGCNSSFPTSDVGLLALASISSLQNITILHLTGLTSNGLAAALLACKGLMKVKLHRFF